MPYNNHRLRNTCKAVLSDILLNASHPKENNNSFWELNLVPLFTNGRLSHPGHPEASFPLTLIWFPMKIKQVEVSPLSVLGVTNRGERAIGNCICLTSPISQGEEDAEQKPVLRHAAVRLFHQCNRKSHQNKSNQRKTRENKSREFKELFKFNETNRVLYVMFSWMDIGKIIYKLLFFFWAAGAQHTDGDMVFALYVDWMAWFSR